MASASPARGPIYEHGFEQDREAIQSDFHRFDDAFRYVEYQLSNEPTSGLQTETEGIWIAPVRLPSDEGVIHLSVFYSFDDASIHFHSIRRHG